VHCRFAMLGAAGILVPDLLHSIGMGGPAAAVPWYEAGTYEYFAPPSALFASMMFLFAWAEGRRWVQAGSRVMEMGGLCMRSA
jgi:hypothetical protein